MTSIRRGENGTTYTTGRPCKHGHVGPRYVKSRQCVECTKVSAEAWRRTNPEKWRKIISSAPSQSWEVRHGYFRDWQKRAREENPEVFAARQKSWRERNPLYHRIANNNRRAYKHGADGLLTIEDFELQEKKQGGRCNLCGAAKTLEIDHIEPLCKGGTNWPDNIQLLCHSCNKSKSLKEH